MVDGAVRGDADWPTDEKRAPPRGRTCSTTWAPPYSSPILSVTHARREELRNALAHSGVSPTVAQPTRPPLPRERHVNRGRGIWTYCFALHVWIHCCASAARAAGVSATGGLLPVEEATACAPSPPSL